MSKIIVSKSKDVFTTTLDEQAFNSNYATLMYYKSGFISLAVGAADAEAAIDHGLGYIPFFIVYVRDPINTDRYSMCPRTFFDGVNYHYINTYATKTSIYFNVNTNSLTTTLEFYYKIFRNDTGL